MTDKRVPDADNPIPQTYVVREVTPFDIAFSKLLAYNRQHPEIADQIADEIRRNHMVAPPPDYPRDQNHDRHMAETLIATDPVFKAALAHVLEKAGPMLARLAKR